MCPVGISEKGLVFATHINIEKEKTQAVCAWEQPNEPSWLLRIPEERSVCRRNEKKRCHSCFLMSWDCWILQVDSGEAQAEALAREWCCWDANRQWKFCNRSMESTMSTCLVVRELNFLVRMLVGYNHWCDFLIATVVVLFVLRSKFKSSEDVAKFARRLRSFPTNLRPRCCSVSFCVWTGYPQKPGKTEEKATCHYQKIVSSINYSDLFCHNQRASCYHQETWNLPFPPLPSPRVSNTEAITLGFLVGCMVRVGKPSGFTTNLPTKSH